MLFGSLDGAAADNKVLEGPLGSGLRMFPSKREGAKEPSWMQSSKRRTREGNG